MSSIISPIVPALCVLHRASRRTMVSEGKRLERRLDKHDFTKL